MKTIERKINNELFSQPIIEEAAKDYAQIVKIAITQRESDCICRFYDGVTDLNRIADEFENYLIELGNRGQGK